MRCPLHRDHGQGTRRADPSYLALPSQALGLVLVPNAERTRVQSRAGDRPARLALTSASVAKRSRRAGAADEPYVADPIVSSGTLRRAKQSCASARTDGCCDRGSQARGTQVRVRKSPHELVEVQAASRVLTRSNRRGAELAPLIRGRGCRMNAADYARHKSARTLRRLSGGRLTVAGAAGSLDARRDDRGARSSAGEATASGPMQRVGGTGCRAPARSTRMERCLMS